MRPAPRGDPLIETAHGTRREAFGLQEWGLLVAIAAIWGSSFLFIEIGLEHFGPGVVAFGRVAIGALTLSLLPRSHRPVDRADLPRVALLGAGLDGGAAVAVPDRPAVDRLVARGHAQRCGADLRRRSRPRSCCVGCRPAGSWPGSPIGFLGVVGVLWPATRDADATALGASLVLLAVLCYGVAVNIAVPLQQRYGALPVLLRAQLVALVLLAPAALVSLPELGVRLVERAGGGGARVLRHRVGVRRDDHARRPGRSDARLGRDLLPARRGDRASAWSSGTRRSRRSRSSGPGSCSRAPTSPAAASES